MPPIKPVTRKELIFYLKKLGFDGPYSGGKHQFLIKDNCRLTIPNPHKRDISPSLLLRILDQAKISRDEWEKL
jgi:predicted RNA binding protein YcfA (HicA-like mRNA interferase family)